MRRPLFNPGVGIATIPLSAGASRFSQSLNRFWVPLQNILIVIAAALLPPLLGMDSYGKLFVMATILLLVSYRSQGGRFARVAQFFYGYGLTCAIFGDIRAVADSTPWANANLNAAWQMERTLFQGQLPSARLQRLFYNSTHISLFDYFITGVYISFFVVPLVAGALIAVRHWRRSRTMVIAQIFVFAIGFLVILVWPSNPPWLTTDSALNPTSTKQDRVYRVTTITLGQGDDYAYGADKNRVAAMPSIHMANTFLVFQLLWVYGLKWRLAGGAYVATMTFAVVYLGEHYAIDAITGIALALGSWQMAYVWQRRWRQALSGRLRSITRSIHPSLPGFGPGAELHGFPVYSESERAESA